MKSAILNPARLSRADRIDLARRQCEAIAGWIFKRGRPDFAAAGLRRDGAELELPGVQTRAMSDWIGPSGAYTKPALFAEDMLAGLFFASSFRPFATVVSTERGGRLDWPTFR